jgi:Asp-tRNA(Asn)/Glu-tRNA(Gln) amidotransferase C subunit
MAIQDQIMVELASVEVSDSYQVQLRQHRRRVEFTPEQARDLANELINVADAAEQLQDVDVRASRTRSELETRGII